MIYFIQPMGNRAGPIKIGTAKNLARRFYSIQCNHYAHLVVRAVTDGGRKEEKALHHRFAKDRRIGEWFNASKELKEFVASLPPLNWRPGKKGLSDEANPTWCGTNATYASKHDRIVRRKLVLGPCEKCGANGYDRRFRDGNPDDYSEKNIETLCRRCSMEKDGRLAKLKALPPMSKQDPKPCSVCRRPCKPLRRGRCHACNEFYRRNGSDRQSGVHFDKD